MPRVIGGRFQTHLTACRSLPGSEQPAVRVNQPLLGNLAQPAERIAFNDAKLTDPADGVKVRLLKNVVGLDAGFERRSQMPVDVRQKLQPPALDVLGERRLIAAADAFDKGEGGGV